MKMPLDEVLMVTALGSYVLAALALLVYFFSREEWLRLFGAPLAVLGCAAQFAQLAVRFETTGVWPLLNLYGSLSLFAAMAVAIFIGFAIHYKLWFAGGFVLALAAIFLAYGVTWNEGTMPAVPSLQSYWAKIHVPIVVSSYAAFLVAFVFSGIYLVKYYAERAFENAPSPALAASTGTTFAAGAPACVIHAPRHARARSGRSERQRGCRLVHDASHARAARRRRLSRGRDRIAADFDRHHHRRDVGQRGMGRILAMGSQRNRRAAFRGSSISRTCICTRATRGAAFARTG